MQAALKNGYSGAGILKAFLPERPDIYPETTGLARAINKEPQPGKVVALI